MCAERMRVHSEYVAAGANRVVNALHWGEHGLVAYGFHNAIAVFDPQVRRRPPAAARPPPPARRRPPAAASSSTRRSLISIRTTSAQDFKVVATLLGHAGRVNCVRWLSAAELGGGAGSAPVLASGAADGGVILWALALGADGAPWRLAARLGGHAAPVTALAACRPAGGAPLLVAAAADGAALVWERGADAAADCAGGWALAQRLRAGAGPTLAAALAAPPGAPAAALLALGAADGRVHLLVRPPGAGARFTLACELGGHADWVRALAFTPRGADLLLASASQDRSIRLWRLAPAGGGGAGAGGGALAALTRLVPGPRVRLGAAGPELAAALEAVLSGHEDWVTSAAWAPPAEEGAEEGEPLLLSASMDRTMAVWARDAATGALRAATA
jgi:elongator complex protein 2